MADFAMKNFHHFPIEKTSYDLKLELLEKLDRKEALQLIKVNSGFRSIYMKDPWRIVGRHVYLIDFKHTFTIDKFPQSRYVFWDIPFHLPLLKKIKSCEKVGSCKKNLTGQEIDSSRRMLSNLDSIGIWESWISNLENFEECFSHFKGQITDYIFLDLDWYSGEENDPTFTFQLSRVIETQLVKCKKVIACFCVDHFSIFCRFFSKTRIKKLVFCIDRWKRCSAASLDMMVRWIVCNGIPSQNPEAEILIDGDRSDRSFHEILCYFLSTFPGIQKMPDEDSNHRYRRKIDNERDCVYELPAAFTGHFRAKYVPSGAK